ncbi:unnamed protein product, partial [Ectocarpus sp. 12 AP-2014]
MGTVKGWLGGWADLLLPFSSVFSRFSKAMETMIAMREVARSFRLAQSVQGYFRVTENPWYSLLLLPESPAVGTTSKHAYYSSTSIVPYALPCDAWNRGGVRRPHPLKPSKTSPIACYI